MGESDVIGKARGLADASVISVPGTPWWVTVFFRAVAVIGIPGLLLGYYAYRDYKFMERSIGAQERANALMERFERVLWKVEKKIGTEEGVGR